MGRSQESFSKKEKEKKKRKKRQDKLEKRLARKAEKLERGPVAFEDNLTYIDENGNFTKEKPDPNRKSTIKAENIKLGVPSREEVDLSGSHHGKVKFFNEEKGFGFIIHSATKESLFVHINNLKEPIAENDKVIFQMEEGPKGLVATKVEKVR